MTVLCMIFNCNNIYSPSCENLKRPLVLLKQNQSLVLCYFGWTSQPLQDWLILQDVAGKSMNAEGLSKSRFHPVHKGPEATSCTLTGNLLGLQTSLT